jgi:hypothetical protein
MQIRTIYLMVQSVTYSLKEFLGVHFSTVPNAFCVISLSRDGKLSELCYNETIVL